MIRASTAAQAEAQALVVADLTSAINDIGGGAYAVSMYCAEDGEIIYGSAKPRTIPTLIDMGGTDRAASAFVGLAPAFAGRFKGTAFERNLSLVRSLSNKAGKLVARNQGKPRQLKRYAFSMVERSVSLAKFAGETSKGMTRAGLPVTQADAVREIVIDTYREAAKEAALAGIVLAKMGGSENLVSAQNVMIDGAGYMALTGMPIAGAMIAGGAIGLAPSWSAMDRRVKRMRQEVGRMWSQSVEKIDDPVSERDRIFLGLVNGPRHKFVRSLLTRLITIREQSEDRMAAAGDMLRLGLTIAKSSDPGADDWKNVSLVVNNAIEYLWGEYEDERIALDDVYPSVMTLKGIAQQSSALMLYARYEGSHEVVAKTREHNLKSSNFGDWLWRRYRDAQPWRLGIEVGEWHPGVAEKLLERQDERMGLGTIYSPDTSRPIGEA